jgi:hypothetical protein
MSWGRLEQSITGDAAFDIYLPDPSSVNPAAHDIRTCLKIILQHQRVALKVQVVIRDRISL